MKLIFKNLATVLIPFSNPELTGIENPIIITSSNEFASLYVLQHFSYQKLKQIFEQWIMEYSEAQLQSLYSLETKN